MSGIKIFLISGMAFIAVYFFVRLRNSLLDLVLLLLLVGAALVFVLFPNTTNNIAHWLGVGRGADLIFYTSILIFWFVILKLYARVRKLEQMVTDLIRREALDQLNQTSDRNGKIHS